MIQTAENCEQILDMVHFKELILTTNQIHVIVDCEYYVDFSIGITLDGTIDGALSETQ